MSPRIDDLSAAYVSLRAFLDADSDMSTAVNVWCMFDNEEVGSGTRHGNIWLGTKPFDPFYLRAAVEAQLTKRCVS